MKTCNACWRLPSNCTCSPSDKAKANSETCEFCEHWGVLSPDAPTPRAFGLCEELGEAVFVTGNDLFGEYETTNTFGCNRFKRAEDGVEIE